MEDSILNTESGQKLLALTKAGLKVSNLIPDLWFREKIKNQILIVYRLFLAKQHSDLLKEIDVLDGFFFLAGQMNFVKSDHLRVLRNGMTIFKSRVGSTLSEPPKSSVKPIPAPVEKLLIKQGEDLSERQKKILEKFQDKEAMRLAEITGFFPDISEKTVRNALASLIGLKKIARSGQGNGSFYQIIRQ